MDKIEQSIIDGFTLGRGLLPPTESDNALMASVSFFPDDLIYDPKDIQKFFADDRWKEDEKTYGEIVRNQEGDGSCNPQANASGVEISRMNQGMEHVPLSASFLYQLLTTRDVGTTLPSTFKAINEIGISPIEVQVGGMTKRIPNTIYSTRTPIASDVLSQAKVEAKRFRGVNLMKVPVNEGIEKFSIVLATMLARKIPVVWAWHVGSSGTRLDGNGYMQVEFKTGNHANVLVSGKWVGGKDLVHPVNMNSWGPTRNPIYGPSGSKWGRAGFGFATMEQAFSCAHIHQPYGIISVNVDAGDDFFQGM